MGVSCAAVIRIVFNVMLRARGVNTLLESSARNAVGGHHRPTLPILRWHRSRHGRVKPIPAVGCRTPRRRVPEGEGEKVRVDTRSTKARAGLVAGVKVSDAEASVARVVSGVASGAGRR